MHGRERPQPITKARDNVARLPSTLSSDVLVAAGDGRNLATAQCKRHLQFGEAAVAAAVRAVTITAELHYLFLSRDIASPGARKEIGKYPGWQLWDGQNISRYIRSLPLDRAVRIVDTYFPGNREAFLGVPSPVPWLAPEDYSAQGRAQMVRHDWNLVGRSDLLDQLTESLYGRTGSLAVVVGRGGTGKTRLLRAVAEACPDKDTQVFLLPAGVGVTPADFELLPLERQLVVLIDDGHERDDLNNLLAGIWRRNVDTRILIATRPYRWDAIRSDLGRNPLAPDQPVMVELGDLSSPEAEDLAREVLGESAHDAVVHRLARLTRDCPLVTVVGGLLIRRGQLDPAELGQDDQVRRVILRGFRNALVSDPMVVDPDTRNAVIDAIAALQPFRTDEDSFRQALSNLIGQPFDVLNRHLRNLEEAGILLRRVASLRIVPDLLGDVVLTDATYDERTQLPTGYLDRVRSSADGQPLQHLFVNVSRVDWQIRYRGATTFSLVESLWEPLEAELRGAGILGRQHLIGLLARGVLPARSRHCHCTVADRQPDR
jgi:AAA ATPase domain